MTNSLNIIKKKSQIRGFFYWGIFNVFNTCFLKLNCLQLNNRNDKQKTFNKINEKEERFIHESFI